MSRMPAVPLRPERDYRVDFWRGIALTMIFVDHIPGNVWERYTTRNLGFSDAAELFVFLAGFASAYAYARLFFAGHRLVATLKAWRRAGVLFLVHVFLTLAALAIFCWAAMAFGEGDILKKIGLDVFIRMPLETIVGLATMTHQFGYVNILPMYVALLLMLPAHLALASIDRRLMLAVSAGVWFLAYCFGIDLPNYPLPGGWFFNPISWQFVFAIGLFCGLARQDNGVSVPYRGWLYAAALAYCLVSFVSVEFELWGLWQQIPLPALVTGFDKTYVTLPRLVHMLALCYLFAHAAPSSPFSRVRQDNPFVMLGRHSLPVFATGTILSLIGQVMKHGNPPAFAFDTLMIAAGLFIQFTLARYLDWWAVAGKTAARPSSDPIAKSAGGSMVAGQVDGGRTSRVTSSHTARA